MTKGEVIAVVCVKVVVIVTVPGRYRSQKNVNGCPAVVLVLLSSWTGAAKVLPVQRSERRIFAPSLTSNWTWSEYGLELSVIDRESWLLNAPKLVPADQVPAGLGLGLQVRNCS